jgi:hypothetical protein
VNLVLFDVGAGDILDAWLEPPTTDVAV